MNRHHSERMVGVNILRTQMSHTHTNSRRCCDHKSLSMMMIMVTNPMDHLRAKEKKMGPSNYYIFFIKLIIIVTHHILINIWAIHHSFIHSSIWYFESLCHFHPLYIIEFMMMMDSSDDDCRCRHHHPIIVIIISS